MQDENANHRKQNETSMSELIERDATQLAKSLYLYRSNRSVDGLDDGHVNYEQPVLLTKSQDSFSKP